MIASYGKMLAYIQYGWFLPSTKGKTWHDLIITFRAPQVKNNNARHYSVLFRFPRRLYKNIVFSNLKISLSASIIIFKIYHQDRRPRYHLSVQNHIKIKPNTTLQQHEPSKHKPAKISASSKKCS